MAREIDYPAFIKPYEGHLWRRHFENKGFVVNSPEELEHRCREILPRRVRFMVQSFILGPASNSYSASLYIAANGECLGSFASRKLRQFPVDAGVGTLVESIRSQELMDLGLHVCQMLDYRGIAEIEFKRDDRDGKLKLIELNPRLWVQSALASSAGVDFARVQFLDLLGHPAAPATQFRSGVRWLDLMADYQVCRELLRRGGLSSREWMQSWLGARSFAAFAPDDVGPFFAAWKQPASEMFASAKRRFSRLASLHLQR
jgi:predicted ATP-grasp superfamily ATP-dependent carboligase